MLNTHWFDLGSVQFPPVEHDSMNGITCPGSLDGRGVDIQEILEEKRLMIIKSMISHTSSDTLQSRK